MTGDPFERWTVSDTSQSRRRDESRACVHVPALLALRSQQLCGLARHMLLSALQPHPRVWSALLSLLVESTFFPVEMKERHYGCHSYPSEGYTITPLLLS